jgi:hypothetical protein
MGHYAPMPRGRWVLSSLVRFTWVGFLWAGFRAKRPACDNNEDGLEDVGMTMDLPGDAVDGLRGRVVCIPR